jgi:pectate lyase
MTVLHMTPLTHHIDHAAHSAFLPVPAVAAAHAAAEGFGATTPGGRGQPEYHVMSLEDSGPGTLRDAVSRGSRHVVFDVAGTIALQSPVDVRGAFVTIDGLTAPAPGISLTNYGLTIRGKYGAHDVIVRGLRVRGPATRETNVKTSNDCISISHGAYNVLIDHVAVSGCTDGAIDIVGNASNLMDPPTRDITVQWSVLADTRKMMLIKYGTTRISLHHNLFVRGLVRHPHVTRQGLPVDDDVTLDMRNNIVWDWARGSATSVSYGARANIIANLYGNPQAATNDKRQALIVCRGDGAETPESYASCAEGEPAAAAFVYAGGNLSLDGVDVDRAGTLREPLEAASISTDSPCVAAHRVLEAARGNFVGDATERGYLASVTLASCPHPPVADDR